MTSRATTWTVMMSEAENISEEQLEAMIPLPVGYRVLICLLYTSDAADE